MLDLSDAIARSGRLRRRIKRVEDLLERQKEELAGHEKRIAEAAKLIATETATGGKSAILTGAGTSSVQVTFPCPSLKLTAENLDDARKLAGPAFAKIAEKIPVPYKLAKSARELIGALLTPGKAAKLRALLASDNAPRFTYRSDP